MIFIKLKSEIVDNVICYLQNMMDVRNKHLMKTESILRMVADQIDLTDNSQEREELMDIGIKQVIQSRLYAHDFFSIGNGFFVCVTTCQNIEYLNMVLDNKDNVLEVKSKARRRIAELISENGQFRLDADENGNLYQTETKTTDEVVADLEADAI